MFHPLAKYRISQLLYKTIIYKALEDVGLLKQFAYRYPHEFSGGQLQRIVIARALITEPRVVVADEPIASLDISIQAQIVNLLKELCQKKNIGLIFIAHDLSMVEYVADNDVDDDSRATLLDVIDTPISPELIPADKDGNITQKTESVVGPYELHDFFLYHFLRFGFAPSKILLMAANTFNGVNGPEYDMAVIKKWLITFVRRFFSQQFKRSCLPDGPKVGSVSLSPRGDWRMPSDATVRLWLDDCEKNLKTKNKELVY